ncbi:MAG: NAD(P)H-dependent oxidoreductase [Oceanococcaceae bacterium]
MSTTDPLLLICWYSATGHNRQLARAAARGARATGDAQVRLRSALRVQAPEFAAAAGWIFVAPENFGQLSGGLRMMFERLFYPLETALQGRPYATISGCGNDGRGMARDVDRICAGWRLRRVAEPVICRGPFDAGQDQQAAELGAAMAAGLAAGVF